MKKFLGLILLMLLPCSALSMWGQTGQQMKLISYNIWNGFEGDSLRRAQRARCKVERDEELQ